MRGILRSLKGPERSFVIRGSIGFCLLLASYTVLRPIRDELGIQGGVENLQWSFTTTFFGMLAVVPLFGFVASKLPKRLLVPIVYLFFAAQLVGFSFALSAHMQPALFARVFFSWVSVFNLVVISLFWTTLSDRCAESRAKILFGPVAAGGSVGAFLGPLLTSQLVRGLGSPLLLLFSAVLLLLAGIFLSRLPVLEHRREGKVLQNEAIGGQTWQGLLVIPKSSFLSRMALLTFVGNVLGTYLYFEQASILSHQVPDTVRRTELLSYVDLSVNGLSLFFQIAVTPYCLRIIPPRFAFSIVPLILVLGFPIIALFPTVPVLFGFQTLRRAALYALGKPVESILFSLRPDTEAYKARNVIDTLIYRLGDTSGAWLQSFLRTTPHLWQTAAQLAAFLLITTTYRLGKDHEKTTPAHPPA